MSDIYDFDGEPISYERWCELFIGTAAGREVARTQVGDVTISTVWLGLNHRFGPGPPLIFETMIFGGPEDLDGEQWRWPNRDAALAGHDQAVALIRDRARA